MSRFISQTPWEGPVAAADKGEQLLAVEVAVILHLGPNVTEAHNGVIGNESSGKTNFDLGDRIREDQGIGEWFIYGCEMSRVWEWEVEEVLVGSARLIMYIVLIAKR